MMEIWTRNGKLHLLEMLPDRPLRTALRDYIRGTETGRTHEGEPVSLLDVPRRRTVSRHLAEYVLRRG